MRLFNRGLMAASILAAFAMAPPAFANPFDGGQASIPCGDGQIVYGPIQLWPPNHQQRMITITYIDNSATGAVQGDNDGDQESLTIDSITDNQVSDDDGKDHGCGPSSKKQGPDWGGFDSQPLTALDPQNITATPWVRAERCARDKSEPRIYSITVSCGDPDSNNTQNPTTVALTVTVPHDRRHAEKVNR